MNKCSWSRIINSSSGSRYNRTSRSGKYNRTFSYKKLKCTQFPVESSKSGNKNISVSYSGTYLGIYFTDYIKNISEEDSTGTP